MPRIRVRGFAFVATVLVTAVATLFGTPSLAGAGPAVPTTAPGDLCTTSEGQNPAKFQGRRDRLKIDVGSRLSCLDAPTPSAPDSGMAGWFASQPETIDQPGIKGQYTKYGYAGYDFTTYDLKCAPTVTHPNVEF